MKTKSEIWKSWKSMKILKKVLKSWLESELVLRWNLENPTKWQSEIGKTRNSNSKRKFFWLEKEKFFLHFFHEERKFYLQKFETAYFYLLLFYLFSIDTFLITFLNKHIAHFLVFITLFSNFQQFSTHNFFILYFFFICLGWRIFCNKKKILMVCL